MKKLIINKKAAFVGGVIAGVGATLTGAILFDKFVGDPISTSFSVKPTNPGVLGIFVYDTNRFGKEKYVTGASFDPEGAVDFANYIMDVAASVANAVSESEVAE